MTANEYANLALRVLKRTTENNGIRYGLATKSLAREMGVADTSRDTLLKVLEKLALLKIIQKQGSGKFLWRILVTDWDERNPFRPPPAEEPEPSYSAPAYSSGASESELS